MRCTIRPSFETNSSSMHSIILTNIDGNSNKGELYAWNDGYAHIWDNDITFERSPFQLLSTMKDKIFFAIASFADDEEKIEEIREITREIFGCELKFPMEDVEEYRRADDHSWVSGYDVEWVTDPEDNTKEVLVYKPDHSVELEYREYQRINGYIDHQSVGLLQNFIKKHDVSLRDFITKAKYIVVIDGDEHCEFENILKSGIVDLSKIKSQYPHNESFNTMKWREEHEDDN